MTVIAEPVQNLNVLVGISGEVLLYGVQPESAYSLIQPEFRYLLEFLTDVRVVELQLRHVFGEHRLVPLSSRLIPRGAPGRFFILEIIVANVLVVDRAERFRKAVFLRGCAARLLTKALRSRFEPRVITRAVVHHKVNEQAYTALFALCGEVFEILHRAELRVYAVVVLHAVLMIGARGHYRREPDPVEAHVLDIIQL